MNKILFLLLVILASCNTKNSELSNSNNPYVFRSVLDEQPRIATVELGDGHYAAYDTQKGILFKAWHGSVALEGAVYTSVHGPQPSSVGPKYFEATADRWRLQINGTDVAYDMRYHGHLFNKGNVSFKWAITTPDGQAISILESPRLTKNEVQPILQGKFTISSSTSYQLTLESSLGLLKSVDDISTKATFTIKDANVEKINEVEVFKGMGSLEPGNGVTYLEMKFHPNFAEAQDMDKEDPKEFLASGAKLIDESDCRACHNENVKTVGPSYLTIAKKYNDDESSLALLTSRVINGGNGVWGAAMMTPHPDLNEAEAREMVQYILSLDDDSNPPDTKFGLGMKSIQLDLENEYSGKSGNGFLVHMYHNPEGIDFLDVPDKIKPFKHGTIDHIHVLEETDFNDLSTDIVLEFESKLEIAADGSYDFRLISDDGSYLFINNQLIIDNGGYHGPEVKDGEMYLKKGFHDIRIVFGQGGGGAMISFQWFDKKSESFVLLGQDNVTFSTRLLKKTEELKISEEDIFPGDQAAVSGVHPSFDLFEARPPSFQPRVGGIDFLDDQRMVVCTWDSLGAVYLVENWLSKDPNLITHKRIAQGLAEPLGLKVVDNEIYILQKQELTKLIDHDGDDIIDEYKTVSANWGVSANFHEFAFGLEYQDGHFYGALATAILPGGASANPQIPDRGKVVKINKTSGNVEFVANGLRTPNGIGVGVDDQLFIADNQGDWLPASKIVHVKKGAFYGSRSVDFEGTENVQEMPPVVWLPQDEIGNSPSTPLIMKAGPYAGQMIHGEVTNGGIKRVYVEEVDGQYQGALFRFSQGFGAGINRLVWAPDGSLMTGGVGSNGNWNHMGKAWFSLQRMVYNNRATFEMLKVSARANGFEIDFTEPISSNYNLTKKDFEIQQWWYKPTIEYGGPKLDQEQLEISDISVSKDRKKVSIELRGMKEGHVVYFRIVNPIKSKNGQGLWSTECWYTMNNIPNAKL